MTEAIQTYNPAVALDSEQGNPTLKTMLAVMDALGMQLTTRTQR